MTKPDKQTDTSCRTINGKWAPQDREYRPTLLKYPKLSVVGTSAGHWSALQYSNQHGPQKQSTVCCLSISSQRRRGQGSHIEMCKPGLESIRQIIQVNASDRPSVLAAKSRFHDVQQELVEAHKAHYQSWNVTQAIHAANSRTLLGSEMDMIARAPLARRVFETYMPVCCSATSYPE